MGVGRPHVIEYSPGTSCSVGMGIPIGIPMGIYVGMG